MTKIHGQGTEFERLGDGVKAFAVIFVYTLNGMPLIYTGQEVGFNHRFKFFQRHSSNVGRNDTFRFYQKLNQLKHSQQALAAGKKWRKDDSLSN